MTTTQRLRSVALTLALLGALAACGGDDGGGDDGVASMDENAAADEGSGDGGEGEGGGGGGEATTDEERQDAMLEFAECMREQGIDMPDPEMDENGGVMMRGPGPDEGGASEEEWEAANEECQPIMDDAMGQMEVDPEQQAEMQDQLVAVAQCMRERGYDMPDPEVDENGGVRMGVTGPEEGEDEDFEQDMDECHEEAGLEGPGGEMGVADPSGGDA